MAWWEITISLFAGALAGLFFFGGLWWTVQRLPRAKAPALLALASLVLRVAVVLGVFYLLLAAFPGEGWPRLAAGLAGFILVRLLLTSRLRPQIGGEALESAPPPAKEGENR